MLVDYRRPKRDGGIKKPGKMWVVVYKSERERVSNALLDKERDLIQQGEGKWNL